MTQKKKSLKLLSDFKNVTNIDITFTIHIMDAYTKLGNLYASLAFIFGVWNTVQLTWSNLSFFLFEKIPPYPTI